MAFVLDISTAVPEFPISKENFLNFYTRALTASGMPDTSKKIRFLLEKTKINNRYSCIPDFTGKQFELFVDDNYKQPVETRMEVYKALSLPLAVQAVNGILLKNKIKSQDITHLITVSCTGLFAPGLEFLLADYFDLNHTEKLALNFLGCYAAIKALKHANYIAEANPNACILIVSVELCSIHFTPSVVDEDIVANSLFADGAAAVLICGDTCKHVKNKTALSINAIGSACIPNTANLMTWEVSSAAFRMYLSKYLVNTIKDNIAPVVNDFLKESKDTMDYWAIHPGGVKIVEAVQDSLGLDDTMVEDAMHILKNYGNMSSPTILFILHRILQKLRNGDSTISKNIFACAFGPGLTVEMIQLSSVNVNFLNSATFYTPNYAIRV